MQGRGRGFETWTVQNQLIDNLVDEVSQAPNFKSFLASQPLQSGGTLQSTPVVVMGHFQSRPLIAALDIEAFIRLGAVQDCLQGSGSSAWETNQVEDAIDEEYGMDDCRSEQ